MIDQSAVFAEFAQDPRIHVPLREILNDRALLVKDRLIFKAPGAHGYGAHQDYTGWLELPAPAEAMVSAVVARRMPRTALPSSIPACIGSITSVSDRGPQGRKQGGVLPRVAPPRLAAVNPAR